MLRKALDKLYTGSGAIAALLIAAICVLMSTQVFFTLITRFGWWSVNLTIPSYGEFAGYFLAASSFLALAYTLTQGGHIRVNLLLTRLSSPPRLGAEILSIFMCLGVSLYATFYIALLCIESYEFGDLSQGMVPVPLWIPQSTVLIGLSILSIALLDCLVRTITTRQSVFDNVETQEISAE